MTAPPQLRAPPAPVPITEAVAPPAPGDRLAPTAPLQPDMLDFDGLNGVIGTPELLAKGQRYAG